MSHIPLLICVFFAVVAVYISVLTIYNTIYKLQDILSQLAQLLEENRNKQEFVIADKTEFRGIKFKQPLCTKDDVNDILKGFVDDDRTAT